MILPLSVKLQDIFTFNLEIPYYNWFYPLQHQDATHDIKLFHENMRLDHVKGAYVHFPFCSSLCSFCPYIRTHIHDDKLRNDYVKQLIKEIHSYERSSKPVLDCIFFGGGSPSLLSPNNFADIIEALQKVFKLSPSCEITVEANAMTLNQALCSTLKSFNVSKIRIGVQSLNTRSRDLYHLKATVDDIKRSTELIQKSSIKVSFDMLFGHHGQCLDSFISDIQMANELDPDSIEIYPINLLSVPDRYWNTFLGAGLQGLSASDRVRFFKAGQDYLLDLGYHKWSGHGFAKSSEFDLLYHRCVYGTLGGLVSFGPGAISFDSDYVKWNHSSIDGYMTDMNIKSTPTFAARKIAKYERSVKKLVTELPYYGHAIVSADDIVPEISSQLYELIDAGVIKRKDSELVLSENARLQYASVMFYLLPARDQAALGREIFSHCTRLGWKFSKDMLWI